MTIDLDTDKFTLNPTAFNKALTRSLNDIAKTSRSEMSKTVRAYYNIKKSDLDPKIKVTKATAGSDAAYLRVRSEPIGLIHFGATQSKARTKGAKVYYKTSAKVLKQGRKGVIKGAFIADIKGARNVFRRTTSKRLPIMKLSVVSPTTMVKRKGVDIVERVVKDKFPQVFDRHFKYYLSRSKK